MAGLLLLLSFGGAILAAPVTLPLLWMAVVAERARGWRWAAVLALVLTTAEVAWALAYVIAGEDGPLIWGLPAGASIVLVVALLRSHRFRQTV